MVFTCAGEGLGGGACERPGRGGEACAAPMHAAKSVPLLCIPPALLGSCRVLASPRAGWRAWPRRRTLPRRCCLRACRGPAEDRGEEEEASVIVGRKRCGAQEGGKGACRAAAVFLLLTGALQCASPPSPTPSLPPPHAHGRPTPRRLPQPPRPRPRRRRRWWQSCSPGHRGCTPPGGQGGAEVQK